MTARSTLAEITCKDPRWTAVLARDAIADGSFYYSVRTSGVYCRPSCPSRPARPENVAFHATPAAAEAAGFRPCKRCKPDMAREEIRFAVGASLLGAVLVARSEKGVCALTLGDRIADLTADLQRRFPKAHLVADGPSLAGVLAQAVAPVARPGQRFDQKLDLRGSDFQRRVWLALRKIPAGKTASYAEIARSIGAPCAMRAVASACGANAVALAVPCHRVVRSDGILSGYRWGIARKRALLANEQSS